MKVLVVEDEPEVVEAIVLCLTMPWPDVTLIATNSGEIAVEVARWLSPDVVLLDLQIDDQYGLRSLEQMRTFTDVPLIILTANNQETARLRAIELGANDYLVKPFTHIDLLGSLKAVLSMTQRWAPSHIVRGQPNDGLIINVPGRQVSRHGAVIDLNPAEWRLLTAVINGKDGAVPRPGHSKNREVIANMSADDAERAFNTLTLKLGNAAGSSTALFLAHDEQSYRLVTVT